MSAQVAAATASAARRPGVPDSTRRSVVADTIRRDSIQDIRIDDHLRIGRGRGEHARHATAAILRPGGPPGITRSG
jgi:hypothetical protein